MALSPADVLCRGGSDHRYALSMFDESASEAWLARYGEDLNPDSAIAPFLRHRSIRKYSARPVTEQTVSELIAAAQSAATSSNLQLWSVVSIQDPELREQIALTAGDQHQVREAPWYFAFIVDLHRIASVVESVGEDPSWLDYKEYEVMGLVDVSLAAERFVCAAEALGLGICYIGAMRNDPYRVRELLGLPDRTFCPFGLCIGYPVEDSTAEIKPRLHQDAVWHRESYASSDVSEYDERMRAFYESQTMKGDVTWSMRSGRRLSKLTGREVLKEFLDEQGFGRR